ncbi:hypothetical protein [Cohnella cholangitidis]|uniref:Uncharacterized protein n=1 Tax=Cohnella cholangitidis TaxID=2598458 RepID=A0A7G5C231_9BACL|nr:hypothetical protein [Cohnella cholangitidis]QMV43265.1 hypothetical protein FPL14_20330 [Cohnella cholangitidis]
MRDMTLGRKITIGYVGMIVLLVVAFVLLLTGMDLANQKALLIEVIIIFLILAGARIRINVASSQSHRIDRRRNVHAA